MTSMKGSDPSEVATRTEPRRQHHSRPESRTNSAKGAASKRALRAKVQELDAQLAFLQADRDRLQAIVEDRNASKLLPGGINVFPTLLEMKADIRLALTVTVSEWVEEAPLSLSTVVPLHRVLSRAFLECRNLVNSITEKHTVFMQGGMGSEGGTADDATVGIFRQHIRQNYRTLFPLTGEHLRRACAEVISKLGRWLEASISGMIRRTIVWNLFQSKLDRVVAEYLPIVVGTMLQYPTVVFSEDCGKLQRFDATVHCESIDGDALNVGQACIVVFPALLIKREGHHGRRQPLSKSYILPR